MAAPGTLPSSERRRCAGSHSVLSPVIATLFALCFVGCFWLVFSEGQDAAVASASLWFGRALGWVLGEPGSIPDAAVSSP